MQSGTLATSEILKPYVPRSLVDWLRESPDETYRRVEGTLAFVDISGFTSMTERLARKGRVGSEEVTDVLNRCFTALLAVAYGAGGSVLKWGGDAVLLLFDGPKHAARAARAAVGMRATLRSFRRLQTSAGFVSLRMSIGVGTGMVDVFLVGASHREMIVCGPAATETVLMEQTAVAGEIVVSPATAAALDPRAVGAAKGPGLLLRAAPDGEDQPAPEVRAEGLDLSPLVPEMIREHLLAGGGESEHRHITVAFVRFNGVDDLLEGEGPPRLGEALDHLVRRVQEAAAEHDVSFHATDIDKGAGKILLVAGAPKATENNEERMLRALRAVVDAGDTALPLQIGVNNGHVFAGDFGPPYRRSHSVMGDAVNLAARVMGKAEPGQILATGSVLERSGTAFETRALEPFSVKGKARPVQAYEVGAIAGTKGPVVRPRLPLVGRQAEMADLIAAMESARAGAGRLVEVVGEPGIGKSRLFDELVERAGAATVLRAACGPYESSTPYHPFRDLLRVLAGVPVDSSPEEGGRALGEMVADRVPALRPWLPLLAVPMDLSVPMTPEVDELDLKFKKERLEEVTGELIAALAPPPLVLLIEDVHFMDDASVDLLQSLCRDLVSRPWLVGVSRRNQPSGFSPPEGPQSITLRPGPLDEEDAMALAGAATEDAPLLQHALRSLASRSGGNPLFLQELAAMVRGPEGLESLPDTVEGLLAAQIDRLPAPDRRTLRYASVLGSSFGMDLLLQVLERSGSREEDAVWRRLEGFLERDADGRARFRHRLLRDAAYEGLPFRLRRDLHARVGSIIERRAVRGDEQAELLSYHFFHAHQLPEAWRYSRMAGERAKSKFANIEAAEFYRRAVDAARRLDDVPPLEVSRVYRSLGDVCERAGLYAEAAEAYRAARRLVAGDPVAEAELLLKEGVVRERSGRYSQALGWYRRGLHRLDHVPDDRREAAAVRAQIAVWYAAARRQQGRYREAIRWCLDAVKEAEASGEREALAHAYRLLDWVYTELGRPESARYRELALPIYEELGDLAGQSTVLNNLGIDAYFEGRWDAAVDLYRRSSEARARTGDAVNAAHGTNNIGEILSDQGHLEEAAERFRETLRVWRAAGFRLGVAFAMSNLGRVAARAGRHEEAADLLDRAAKEFAEIGAEGQVLETQARQAENHLLAGEIEEARSLALAALVRAEEREGMGLLRAMLHRIRGCALVLEGREEEGLGALEASLEIGRGAGIEFEVALTLEAMVWAARLRGEHGEAEAAWDAEAGAIFARLGVVSRPGLPDPVVATPEGPDSVPC